MACDRPPNPLPRLSATESARRRKWGENNINAGRLREFPWISIDKFYGEHLKATIFILTHCHTDHMVGLDEEEFWNRLQEPEVKLYLHHITPLLLPLFERSIRGKEGIEYLMKQRKLVPLEVHKRTSIVEPVTGTELQLTLLPAGHCPGSVMVQLEYDEQCILYTGDCRISKSDLEKLTSLHVYNRSLNSTGQVITEKNLKTITHLYIDTTFCSSRSQDFPGRVEALDKIDEVVEEWLRVGRHNRVNLKFAAQFSHEYVLVRLHNKFRIQFHVNRDRYAAYQKIPSLAPAVTLESDSKFHLCVNDSPCMEDYRSDTNGKVLKIKLSSLWFMKNRNGTGPKSALNHDKEKNILTICYAMHSSLDEIGAMINYVKPKVVTPLVLPKGMRRYELETELRQSTTGAYVYEDYERGLHSRTVLRVKDAVEDNTEFEVAEREVNQKRPLSPRSAERERKKNIKWDFRWSPSPPASPTH